MMKEVYTVSTELAREAHSVLKAEAQRRGVSVAAVVRWAISEYLAQLGVTVHEPLPRQPQIEMTYKPL